MSIDKTTYCNELARRLMIGRGWSEAIAKDCSSLAFDVLCDTHGGGSHYVPARKADHKMIQSEYAAGLTVAALAKRHGLTAARIRQIVKV